MHLFVREADGLHHVVRLADQLHVAVFDAVVDHLHEMARAVFADPVAARLAFVRMRADLLEDVLHQRPCGGAAARHHARADQRAFLTAGNARSDVQKTFGFKILRTTRRVREMAVAAVDDDVAGLHFGNQQFDEIVDGLTGLDHQHDLVRTLQIGDQLFDAVCADDVLAFAAAVHEVVDFAYGTVEAGDGESLALHVQNQIFTHDGKTDQTDVSLLHCWLLDCFVGFNMKNTT